MYDLKAANEDYSRDINEIRRFTNSKNESVKLSAEGMEAELKGLVKQNQKLIVLIAAANANASRGSDILSAKAHEIVVNLINLGRS
jgi:hypothetical protein